MAPQALDELQRDHRNMRLLLDIVEEEIEAYGRSGSPDFDLLDLVAEYMLHYPDMVHHPRENLIYQRLVQRDPKAAGPVGNLVAEHARLAELTQRLVAAIRNTARDVELPRVWLDELVRRYLSESRAHMQAEEHQFFPRALAALTDADWAELDARFTRPDDPVFGSKVTEGYARLHQRIMRLHI